MSLKSSCKKVSMSLLKNKRRGYYMSLSIICLRNYLRLWKVKIKQWWMKLNSLKRENWVFLLKLKTFTKKRITWLIYKVKPRIKKLMIVNLTIVAVVISLLTILRMLRLKLIQRRQLNHISECWKQLVKSIQYCKRVKRS